ncbi:LINE-1 retrotransposable element ORF1 protein [Labeo rohita]|uniref:LINE-1 retrotransposable element ORF1 protein n=1 Tax=Labeo rohita TaxID=84645 RepID=A0ABQ8L5R4_LABRO|nr:LINE-1 retrotransposable element ORF1 protein [Labeo rohita]
MRRSNIRILNVAEGPGSSSPDSVSKLLKEVLGMDREVLVDRSHHGLQPRQPGGKPRGIVAKLHYYKDCVEILRKAREAGPLQFKGSTIHIFPDYPPSVACARSAFNDVKKLLRGRDGVHYGIFHPAKLRITYNGNEKEFCDPVEAMAFVKRNIVLDKVE